MGVVTICAGRLGETSLPRFAPESTQGPLDVEWWPYSRAILVRQSIVEMVEGTLRMGSLTEQKQIGVAKILTGAFTLLLHSFY